MKWFKKNIILGHYVKYSDDTAKRNPSMILNEYDRLINNCNDRIAVINKEFREDFINFRTYKEDTLDKLEYNRYGICCTYKIKTNDFKLKISKLKLFEEYEQYLKGQEAIKKLTVEKEMIDNECDDFTSNYEEFIWDN